MPRCTQCGITILAVCIFRGREYCKEHYEEHMDREKDVVAFQIKQMEDTWSKIREIPPDKFDEFLRKW